MIRAVFFDLDGTLVDSLPGIAEGVNRALASLGLPTLSREAVRGMIGRGAANLCAAAIGYADAALAPEKELKAMHDAFRREYPHCWQGREYTHPYPGIPDLLSELERRGIRTGVVSNKADELVQEIVRESGLHFDFISGQRTDFPLKPDPSLLLHGISDVGSDSAHTVYVGDSEVDAETGRRACVETVIVSYGFRTKEELGASGILKTVENPSELGALLSAHFKSAW